jgi:diguanylate cyclase (GGDEF)-like protein
MELKTYLKVIIRRWWIILLVLAATLASTYVFTINQTPIYETVNTFIMRPRASFVTDEDEVVRVVDTLSRRTEINTTYAEVASSTLIKKRAIERLGLSSRAKKGLSISSKVIAGTNILEISVQGPDPVVLKAFANAVSDETRDYVSNLYDVFELEPLDEAEIPTTPVKPKKMLNLAVGGILGLILGIVLVFLTEYLLETNEEPVRYDIIDHETGAFNKSYLTLRLRQEVSRAQRNYYPLSLAMLKVDHQGLTNGTTSRIPVEALRKVTALLRSNLREEDDLTRFDDTSFAFLLPDTTGQSASVLMEELRIKIGATALDQSGTNTKLGLQGVAGIAAYEDFEGEIEADEFLAQATSALRSADNTTFGAVILFSKPNRPLTEQRNANSRLVEHRPSENPSDRLTKIKGIGPARQQWFRESLNVRTFQDLAVLSVDEIESQLKAANQIAARDKIEQWIIEAQELAGAPQTSQQTLKSNDANATGKVNSWAT